MNTKKISIVPFFILLISTRLIAQQPLNLDFEVKSVEGMNRPWGWDLKSWGSTIFKMDSLTVKNGRFSMHSICQDNQNPCTIQSMLLGIESFELKNQKITLIGNIKTLDLNGNASFSLGYTYFNRDTDSFSEIDTTSIPVSGSTEWKKNSVDIEIPDSAQMVYITVNHSGTGEAWFDDFKLSISGKLVNEVMVVSPLSEQEKTWLLQHSDPINYVYPTDTNAEDVNKNNDLIAFENLVSNSRLIALGEATHGTSEFFSLKNRLFQYAVTDMGFRVFAIEDNQLVIEKVNNYVHGGGGTAIESMRGMFDVWYTEEILALIEWMKSYNKIHIDDQLSFVGFDMQEINRPIDSLFEFLKKRNTTLFEKSTVVLKDLRDNGSNSCQANDSIKLSWVNSAKELLEEVKIKSIEWLSTSKDVQQIMMGVQYARLVKQFAENTYKGHWSLYRDEAMAENIIWLLESRFPKSKIVIWAHDVHISRGDHPSSAFNLNSGISMGSFLSKKYGDEYKSFSLSTYQGEYLALTSYFNFTKIHCPLFKGPIGSLDEALHQVSILKKSSNLFLELPRTENWLNVPLPKRFANHVNIDYGYWERVSIPYQFDGIFFIDKTNSTQQLKK